MRAFVVVCCRCCLVPLDSVWVIRAVFTPVDAFSNTSTSRRVLVADYFDLTWSKK